MCHTKQRPTLFYSLIPRLVASSLIEGHFMPLAILNIFCYLLIQRAGHSHFKKVIALICEHVVFQENCLRETILSEYTINL